MRVVGTIATALAATGALGAAVTVLFSISDARRYFRMRRMSLATTLATSAGHEAQSATSHE